MIRFIPEYKPVPWGGRRLADELGRTLPEGPIGESWELVDIEGHHSRVRNGPHEGKTLRELWEGGALGGSARGPFPFLLKWLDTSDKLSVQVHPDEAAVARMGKGQPKTEAWFVAHVEPKAQLLLGHYPGLEGATLEQAARGGTIAKWLYETHPRVGDMILVPAGTLHAIGGGFVLLEVQQPSDTTYRVYDWDRLGLDGHPRELHLEEAAQSVDYDRFGPVTAVRNTLVGPCFAMGALPAGERVAADGLRVFVGDAAGATLHSESGEEKLAFGDVVVAEPGDGEVTVAGGTCILLSEPDKARTP